MQETASSDAEDAADGSCEQPVPFSPNITWVEDKLIPNGRIQVGAVLAPFHGIGPRRGWLSFFPLTHRHLWEQSA